MLNILTQNFLIINTKLLLDPMWVLLISSPNNNSLNATQIHSRLNLPKWCLAIPGAIIVTCKKKIYEELYNLNARDRFIQPIFLRVLRCIGVSKKSKECVNSFGLFIWSIYSSWSIHFSKMWLIFTFKNISKVTANYTIRYG